ncbi:hypothetical protein BB561_001032 [Smittium simulii]|uniref:Uncharacterized protein n=1 Tax=Smittium simulii TaxID=133385 RepID=A0A2T9YWE5_9FUNG|nr:hypothetical protein BB561_001032 [Smittium simulii]
MFNRWEINVKSLNNKLFSLKIIYKAEDDSSVVEHSTADRTAPGSTPGRS